MSNQVRIGIIRGRGSGNQLANIFRNTLVSIGEQLNLNAKEGKVSIHFEEEYERKGKFYNYHTYRSILDDGYEKNMLNFRETSKKEADKLYNTYYRWRKLGVQTVFRTAINAESLYRLRQKVKAVKEFSFRTLQDRKILIIRDQAEGFYANLEYNIDKDDYINKEKFRFKQKANKIIFHGQYSKSHQQEVVRYALERGHEVFGEHFKVWAIYKNHLFGNYIESWIQEIDENIRVVQPDTGLTDILNDYIYANAQIYSKKGQLKQDERVEKDLLVICSNEIGDLIYEFLMGTLNMDAKLELYTRNVFLGKEFAGEFEEYQNVHGSADDIANTQKVKPYSTIRIAAEIAEKIWLKKGIKKLIDEAIVESKMAGIKGTNKIADFIISQFNLNFKDKLTVKSNHENSIQ